MLRKLSSLQPPPIIHIELHPTLQHILGFTTHAANDYGKLVAQASSPIHGIQDLDLNRSLLTTLWIFSDIVQPSYVCDTTRPLLRCMALDRKSHQISYESISNMHYKPLNTSNVQRIKIWFSEDHLGIPLYSKSKSYILLDFFLIV